ncbi:AcrR family transcriptional regulator [Rhizobium sp. BK275]|uniref:TetR/AcrR family transcriptional regulator n=1 Tax=Rhizobium sp. BK275 TaxID=2587077 RepID=UPI0016112B51|nr:TetR/AcrR family transcriptional regulator [Rhizobium sp. BK275]MBB3393293.1 AcrR family transcriptional regulator [Rhizobium sp. BK275]
MAEGGKTIRQNQRQRTRKDLLEAATRLMKQGNRPTLEDVAVEALVSRATAYRYFPSVEALLLEASIDIATPGAEELFGNESSTDPATRVQLVDQVLHDMILANEAPLRIMLAQSLERRAKAVDDGELLGRQNRRTPLIEAALEPARGAFDPKALEHLIKALSLIVGPEAMVVCKDVLQLDDADAREVKRWAIRTLVAAAQKGHG